MNLLHLVRKVVLETHYSCVMKLESKAGNTEKSCHTADSSGARKDGLEPRNCRIWAPPTSILVNSLTKLLLGKFNFDGYKILVNNIRQKIQETSLENNLFSHSPNPLMTMCLTYEVLKSVAKRCFSLSYDCIQLNNQLK